MKLFHFYRVQDHSGVSGTGPVVEGVQFTNGWCALRWISNQSSMCFYQSLEDVKRIHSHGGKTEIVVHDFEPLRKRQSPGGGRRFGLMMEIIEEAARVTHLADDSEGSRPELVESISHLRSLLDDMERQCGLTEKDEPGVPAPEGLRVEVPETAKSAPRKRRR